MPDGERVWRFSRRAYKRRSQGKTSTFRRLPRELTPWQMSAARHPSRVARFGGASIPFWNVALVYPPAGLPPGAPPDVLKWSEEIGDWEIRADTDVFLPADAICVCGLRQVVDQELFGALSTWRQRYEAEERG